MRKEQMPAFVAPEGFQAHQCLISGTTPKLARAFEAALVLPTSRFDGATALWLAGSSGRCIIHPMSMLLEIVHFALHDLTLLVAQPLGQCSQVTQKRRSPAAVELGQSGQLSDSKSIARHRPPPALWPLGPTHAVGFRQTVGLLMRQPP